MAGTQGQRPGHEARPYTVTGKVPGTPFQPKATVVVKTAVRNAPVPGRAVESFPLGQVVLERDTKGRDTPFIRHRDKFLNGLAATDPDSFLYNFRDAFGQPQPAGVRPLGGWDSQTTRLRGHASGHYLSAIAQAYAGTTYDEALRANFLRRMNTMLDALCDLSRKSGTPAQEGGAVRCRSHGGSAGPGPGGQNETCCTYNLLKLDRQLFMFEQTAGYMDHYERGLYNHILASVAEHDAGNTYHVPLNPGSQKRFGNADMSAFTCCNGTALESSTKLQDSIYFRSADSRALFVNLFIPSTLTWSERKLIVRQVTDFPYADTTRLVLEGNGGRLDVKVRVPRWATRGVFARINGREQSVKAVPGTYLTLARDWRDNDTIELRMPFGFSLDPVVDQPNLASIFYGPVLLAAEEPGPRADWRPVTLDAGDIGKTITGDPTTLRFSVDGVALKPFFDTYGRYSVYLHVTLK